MKKLKPWIITGTFLIASGLNACSTLLVRNPPLESDVQTLNQAAPVRTNDMPSTESLARDAIKNLEGDLTFVPYGTALSADAKRELTSLAETLKTDPSLKIKVEGYTDNLGSKSLNQSLSNQRARAVANVLLSQGIASNRIEQLGMAWERPIATNSTPEGRTENRRVEIKVQK